jgi:hypothetical protein
MIENRFSVGAIIVSVAGCVAFAIDLVASAAVL